jgi:hypothetical protein
MDNIINVALIRIQAAQGRVAPESARSGRGPGALCPTGTQSPVDRSAQNDALMPSDGKMGRPVTVALL